MTELLPLFLNLTGRTVLLVGGGPVATSKLRPLLAAGARVRIVAPEITDEIAGVVQAIQAGDRTAGCRAPRDVVALRDVVAHPAGVAQPVPGCVTLAQRPFIPADLDEAWLVVAAATPEVNRHVAEVAETMRVFVNAVDDPPNASAYLSGVVRRDGVTIAISTSGAAPALTSLLREGIDALLPRDLATWVWHARVARVGWRRDGVPMEARKPRLLQALNRLYRSSEELRHDPGAEERRHDRSTGGLRHAVNTPDVAQGLGPVNTPDVAQGLGLVNTPDVAQGLGPAIPWLNAPEDSWL